MTLNDDKTAETNFFGIPVSGTYQIDGNKLELSFSGQVLRGEISDTQIKFADITLQKGVTSPIIPDDEENNNLTTEDETEAPSINYSEAEETSPAVEFADTELQQCILDTYNVSTVTESLCEKITELNTTGYKLSTLEDLEKLPNLTTLYVNNSGTDLSLKGVNKVPNLTSLTLIDCNLQEVDRIADLENLEYLDISTFSGWGTDVTDYSTLSALKNLKTLNMAWYNDNAYNDYGLTDASFINELTNLEVLDLFGTGIENYDLSGLSKLRRLAISHCDPNTIFEQLESSGAINNLEMLDISRTAIGDDFISNHLSKASNLHELYITFDGLSSLEGIENLSALNKLYINNNTTFDIPMSEYSRLGSLENVKDLYISEAPTFDNGHPGNFDHSYDFLSGMKSLECIEIAPFDGMTFDPLADLEHLEYIKLNGGFGSYDTEDVDISRIGDIKNLKDFLYANVKFKSTAPLDDLDYLNVAEFNPYDDSSYYEDLVNRIKEPVEPAEPYPAGGGDTDAEWAEPEEVYVDALGRYCQLGSDGNYYDSETGTYFWFNTEVTPPQWQYWVEGISDDYGDYGWMEYDDAEQQWYIESEDGWDVLPADYDADALWHFENANEFP